MVWLAANAHVQQPARSPRQLAGLGELAAPAGVEHAVADVAAANPRDRQIDGEQQCVAAVGQRLLQQALHRFAVAQHIELEPGILPACRLHLGQRADAHGGQAERHADRSSRPRGLGLATARVEPGHAQRRQRQGHARRLANQLAAGIGTFHVAEHPLAQMHAPEVPAVGGQGVFVASATVDVIE